jgi:predicted RNA-binding protein associated with RNAse of E/G family
MTQAPTVDVHRPKVEYFDLADLTNTDPKGFVRPVERYRAESWGLYMARTSDHPQFHYIESWLLPGLSIRVTVFHYHPEHQRDQDYYVDLGEFTQVGPKKWKSVDHYLDIVVRTERDTELLDVDELLAAHAAGLIGPTEAQAAVENAAIAIDGIAANGHSLERWLATLDITLTWQ